MAREQSYLPVNLMPWGGLNTEDNPAQIDDTEVQSSRNMLWARKRTQNRPGLFSQALTGTTGNEALAWFAQDQYKINAVNPDIADTLQVGIGASGAFYSLNGVNATLIPGAGAVVNPSPPSFPNLVNRAVVNGAMLITSQLAMNDGGGPAAFGGLLRYVPGDATFTQVHLAKVVNQYVTPTYITSLLSRAVAAYDASNASGIAGAMSVFWSVAGDETTWTGATNGSGTAVLSDAADGITGLGTINGTLVIPRFTGIHLGISTGQAFPAFRFINYNQANGIGCFYPGTFCVHNNIAYFVGKDNVYTFDSVNPPQAIGGKIRSLLLAYLLQGSLAAGLTAGIRYVGFISQGQSAGIPTTAYEPMHTYYHLFPISLPGQNNSSHDFPHFAYDIIEGKWSMHLYSNYYNYATNYGVDTDGSSLPTIESLGLIPNVASNAPIISVWDQNTACEELASFRTKLLRIGSYDRDYILQRLFMNYRTGYGDVPPQFVIIVRGTLGTAQIVKATVPVTPGLSVSTWTRNFFDGLRATYGNDIDVLVSVAANTSFATDYIGMQFVESGGLRGF